MSVEGLYNRVIDQALKKHFPKVKPGNQLLGYRILVKCNLVDDILIDKLQSATLPETQKIVALQGRLMQQHMPSFGQSDADLWRIGSLDEELKGIFARLHAHDPEEFARTLEERIDRAAARIAEPEKSVSWIKRVGGGKVAALIGGGAVVAGGAAVLVRHHQDEDKQPPSPAR
jgi:hypothetical protein